MPKNARFWYFANEWVRLTLKPGQTLTYTSGGQTDEGYDVTEWHFIYDGEYVAVEVSRDARDCDGRMQDFGEMECPVSQLATEWNDYGNVFVPDWQRRDHYRLDHSAIAAGY